MHSSQAEITQQSQQKYLISGVIDFNTAAELMQRATGFFNVNKLSDKKGPDEKRPDEKAQVDMSKVTECNSAGLALMFEMVKHARAKKIELQFENLPEALLTIAKAYGVEAEVKNISR